MSYMPRYITQFVDGQVLCPLCEWTAPMPTAQYAPHVAAAFGITANALADIHLSQGRVRLEYQIRQHLDTHSLQEWLEALMSARDRVAELEAERAERA